MNLGGFHQIIRREAVFFYRSGVALQKTSKLNLRLPFISNQRPAILISKMNTTILEQNNIIIQNQDCFEFCKSIADESVDLVLTSPPYCMHKAYENLHDDVETFKSNNHTILCEAIRVLKKGGSLCWQVGYHVKDGLIVPLDVVIYNLVQEINKSLPADWHLLLKNRIIWTFGHGLHSENRFSGRHETILWFTKGENAIFNLDCVRVPQKYPGKKYSKGPRKGQYSGNPNGKNPSDVWDIPNVKSHHVEKTDHPCQFPEALAQRLILALTNPGDVVFDPYSGSGTTALACYLNGRRFIGSELDVHYYLQSIERLCDAISGDVKIRLDFPPEEPDLRAKVAQKPNSFK